MLLEGRSCCNTGGSIGHRAGKTDPTEVGEAEGVTETLKCGAPLRRWGRARQGGAGGQGDAGHSSRVVRGKPARALGKAQGEPQWAASPSGEELTEHLPVCRHMAVGTGQVRSQCCRGAVIVLPWYGHATACPNLGQAPGQPELRGWDSPCKVPQVSPAAALPAARGAARALKLQVTGTRAKGDPAGDHVS